jgi:hypothetical protein
MITELDTIPGKREDDWTLNVYEEDASAGVVLRQAMTDYRHGIRSIIITVSDNEQVTILNGSKPLIGPLNLEKGIPWRYSEEKIYCDRGDALILKTESNFPVHLLIRGDTGVPVSSESASLSASPSEGA